METSQTNVANVTMHPQTHFVMVGMFRKAHDNDDNGDNDDNEDNEANEESDANEDNDENYLNYHNGDNDDNRDMMRIMMKNNKISDQSDGVMRRHDLTHKRQ